MCLLFHIFSRLTPFLALKSVKYGNFRHTLCGSFFNSTVSYYGNSCQSADHLNGVPIKVNVISLDR